MRKLINELMKDGWFFLDCILLNVKPHTGKLEGLDREIKRET